MTASANNKKSRIRWSLLAAIAFFLCCGCLAYFSIVPFEGPRLEPLKADLEEQLPEGSNREQAMAWFASHRLKASEIIDRDWRSIGLMVIIPNRTLLENAEIVIELYFDEASKLRKRVIYRFVYSL